jgi:hypothetical protein
MMIKRQREVALALVVVVALTVALVAYRARTSPAPAAAHPSAVSPTSRPPASKDTGLAELNLPSLSAPRGALQETVRDPFRFKPPPPPPPPPTVARPAIMQPTEAVGPPPPPRIALKFIGTVETKKGVLAGLSDNRGVYKGYVGDIIEGRYRILRIGVESIDLAYLDGRGKQTIRLYGQ